MIYTIGINNIYRVRIHAGVGIREGFRYHKQVNDGFRTRANFMENVHFLTRIMSRPMKSGHATKRWAASHSSGTTGLVEQLARTGARLVSLSSGRPPTLVAIFSENFAVMIFTTVLCVEGWPYVNDSRTRLQNYEFVTLLFPLKHWKIIYYDNYTSNKICHFARPVRIDLRISFINFPSSSKT